MNLPDLKDLGKVLDLCRKKGVSSITLGDLKIDLGPEPVRQYRAKENESEERKHDPSDPWANFPAGELSPEQLAYYSSGGLPGQEPWTKDKEA